LIIREKKQSLMLWNCTSSSGRW